jgi:alcohol dehydrogenase class IV
MDQVSIRWKNWIKDSTGAAVLDDVMTFEFSTATRILFGPGRIRELPALARDLGSRALVVTGRSTARVAGLITELRAHGLEPMIVSIPGEPTTQMVIDAARQGLESGIDVVIGVGGGSALDAGKAIAAMLTNPGDLLDYLEVIGHGRPIERVPAPFLAVPTTAGTGAEVTRNAVLASPQHRLKVSLRSPLLLPRLAIVDPNLTHDLPPHVTAATGLDTLTQLIEAFVSCRANPMTDALCREGLPRAARSLPIAWEHAALPVDSAARANTRYVAAREEMALASLFSGLALANAGLGAVHGFAAPIGGRFHAPHGAVCAALLPHVMTVNLRALRERTSGGEAMGRYTDIAHCVTGDAAATADHLVEWISRLVETLRIPALAQHGITTGHVAELVEQAGQASSMRGNPIALTPAELTEILELALTTQGR